MVVDGDERVEAFWLGLGLVLPGLIDVHTHFMPERVPAKVWAYFDAVGPLVGRAWPIAYRYEEAELLAVLRGFGVRAFALMISPHKPGTAQWLNGWAAGFAARTPDCLRTATFFPEAGAEDYVRAELGAGARVSTAHVQVGAYGPGDVRLDVVWGALAEAGAPVVVHCGSGPAPGKHTGPEPVGRLLARHPRLRLVVAHMGMPEYTDFLGMAERYEGVHLDTTMAFTDFAERAAPIPRTERGRLADLGGRILFGSDFPDLPYGYAHALEVLARLETGDDWLRGVCHGNARRLFGL
ncbi:amidohydrolase family protein [Streptomyces sp. NPDC026294]|uniref:amidohydrolase family protein n=1 Tax=Streptomyces sp. NPDC026294 TaxID=3155362 RepID=UPI0033EFA0D7